MAQLFFLVKVFEKLSIAALRFVFQVSAFGGEKEQVRMGTLFVFQLPYTSKNPTLPPTQVLPML